MTTFFNGVIEQLKTIILNLANMLPKSPFQWEDVAPLRDVLGYVNYFIPIGTFVTLLTSWCTAIAFWYAIMVVLRFAKVIE